MSCRLLFSIENKMPSYEEWKKFTVERLKAEMVARDLKYKSKTRKDDLISTLMAHDERRGKTSSLPPRRDQQASPQEFKEQDLDRMFEVKEAVNQIIKNRGQSLPALLSEPETVEVLKKITPNAPKNTEREYQGLIAVMEDAAIRYLEQMPPEIRKTFLTYYSKPYTKNKYLGFQTGYEDRLIDRYTDPEEGQGPEDFQISLGKGGLSDYRPLLIKGRSYNYDAQPDQPEKTYKWYLFNEEGKDGKRIDPEDPNLPDDIKDIMNNVKEEEDSYVIIVPAEAPATMYEAFGTFDLVKDLDYCASFGISELKEIKLETFSLLFVTIDAESG